MTDIEFLRHTLATIAYRAAKTMRGAPASFATFIPGPTSNSPLRLVAHLGDLIEFSHKLLKGDQTWINSEPQEWDVECRRFFAALKGFDDFLASGLPRLDDIACVLQGPVSDALTHIGQLAMLRRLSGSPMKGESYRRADIAIGRVGYEQFPIDPKYEFD